MTQSAASSLRLLLNLELKLQKSIKRIKLSLRVTFCLFALAEYLLEQDFDAPKTNKKKENPVYYKDLVRQSLTENTKNKKTPRDIHDEEQQNIKDAFKMAANMNEEDDLFKVREKTRQQVEDENQQFTRFLEDEKAKSKPEEIDMLQRFWGDEANLDDTDKFLRKYILTKG